jgi:hypothetical protein
MTDIEYSIDPVDEKPEKKLGRKKGVSKYNPIIKAFLESGNNLVSVENTGLEAYYLCLQLKKVCNFQGIENVKVSVVNKEVYLEKKTTQF